MTNNFSQCHFFLSFTLIINIFRFYSLKWIWIFLIKKNQELVSFVLGMSSFDHENFPFLLSDPSNTWSIKAFSSSNMRDQGYLTSKDKDRYVTYDKERKTRYWVSLPSSVLRKASSWILPDFFSQLATLKFTLHCYTLLSTYSNKITTIISRTLYKLSNSKTYKNVWIMDRAYSL